MPLFISKFAISFDLNQSIVCEHSAFVLAHNYVFCDKMAHFGRIVKPLCGAFWRWLGCFLLRTDFRRPGFGAAGIFVSIAWLCIKPNGAI